MGEISARVNEDNVHHPSHYKSHPSGVECIQIAEHMDFLLGSVQKYIWRAGLKTEDPLEDLKKARWYLDRKIANLESGVTVTETTTGPVTVAEFLDDPTVNAELDISDFLPTAEVYSSLQTVPIGTPVRHMRDHHRPDYRWSPGGELQFQPTATDGWRRSRTFYDATFPGFSKGPWAAVGA